jgi:hypothetical protein
MANLNSIKNIRFVKKKLLLSPDPTFRVKRRDFLVVQNFIGFCLYMSKEI